MTSLAALDEAKLGAFEERLVGTLNAGALCLMTSIGHRTGLFDAMAQMPPASSGEIASGAGLNERYVREWLGAMFTAGMVEHDPEAGTYRLPAEHAARLTRAATPANIALQAQYIALLGVVEDDIVGPASARAAACPIAATGAFTSSWPRTAGSPSCPCYASTSCPWRPA
jgi:hypothetical protein